MRVCVGVDLGSTTTKSILLDEAGRIVGKGITNSRSDYAVASAVARDEALTSARFDLLAVALRALTGPGADEARAQENALRAAFRLQLHLVELAALDARVRVVLDSAGARAGKAMREAVAAIFVDMEKEAPKLFLGGEERRSDFFRDLAGAAYLRAAERLSSQGGPSFEELAWPFDRAILDVETELRPLDFLPTLHAASSWIIGRLTPVARARLLDVIALIGSEPIQEVAFSGTGYGRQTLPFPKAAVRSEILCHGRGAHRSFTGTRTVLDIGGQDTKAIQVDENGVVTSFQMNDRCAAGCGRYLGYIADELNLGLHELGPLALKSERTVRINSTCTVFAGAELRERLGLGEKREDILAGLHRAIMMRAMSLLARSGGVKNELTFSGGVCKNQMATKVLRDLVSENYGEKITINAHPDSIYMGALGAAEFALDDLRHGTPSLLVVGQTVRRTPSKIPVGCADCSAEQRS